MSEPQDTPDPAERADDRAAREWYEKHANPEGGWQTAVREATDEMVRQVMEQNAKLRDQLARLSAAAGVPGAGVDEAEAGIKRMQDRLCVQEANYMQMASELAEAQAENERLRAELAEREWTSAELAETCAVWRRRALQAEDDVVNANALHVREARDTGTDRPDEALIARCVESAMTASGSFLGDPDLKRDEYWRNIVGAVLSEVDRVWADAPAPASPVPPAPDEAREALLDRCARAAIEAGQTWRVPAEGANGLDWWKAVASAVLAEAASAPAPDAKCVCPRFTDTGGIRIADLACPIHGVGGTEPGDGYWDDSHPETAEAASETGEKP